MTLLNIFRRRKIGPLSASPVELIVLCLLVAMAWKIADGVYRDKTIRQELYAAIDFARPIATQARWMHESTGKWPGSLGDLTAVQVTLPKQVAQVQFLQDQGVRLLLAGTDVLASKGMILRVITRDGGYFLECEAGELPRSPLPHICKERRNAEPLPWPPAQQ